MLLSLVTIKGGDIEGAIAVQGDMDASGYTIVGAAANI